MKNFVYLLGVGLFATSCATVGSIIEGGKDLTLGIVDSGFTAAGNITAAVVEDASGVVSTVVGADVVDPAVENVDKQTNELQNEDKE